MRLRILELDRGRDEDGLLAHDRRRAHRTDRTPEQRARRATCARARRGADDGGKAVEVGGRTIRHLDHYVVEIDAPEPVKAGDEPRLARFSVAPTAAAGDAIVWISAITVERRGAHPFVPLALGSTDRRGFPMAMRRGNPAPRELRLAPKGTEGPARAVLLESGEGRSFEVMELRLLPRGAVMRAAADPARGPRLDPDRQRIPIRAGIEV